MVNDNSGKDINLNNTSILYSQAISNIFLQVGTWFPEPYGDRDLVLTFCFLRLFRTSL